MTQQRIFAFTGYPGSGKSTVAEAFAGFDGFPIVEMGKEIELHHDRSLRGGGFKTWGAASELRGEFGERGPALASLSQITTEFTTSDIVVVDGVRSPVEVDTFENVFNCRVHLVAVTADKQTRIERCADRADYYDAFSDMDESEQVAEAIAEFELTSREDREAEVGLDDAIDYANYTITNDGTKADTEMQCARLLDDFDFLIR